ncbi:hypothetical protein FRB90_011122 [Tulasnella sp. 427]|nr:hypothetical protein FRB90_011122 [Tulasnella sp. 427]
MASMYQQPPPQPNVVYMAPQQPSQGTLMPGQSITLKHYTVTVERYLSQGGFAHVYLVRSAMPINGTTSHVLKRIAVSDDIMLKEVQKEVDVMKVLRGHPNIVNLIDSASFPHSNGTHEVFILMEYCAGGGIIDMMNRRLRERLTESEILTIFVEVLEGVACMHNLKPALLHRDLKVENILQASEKSYKLCDFGSAATAALKSPTTTAEIRAIEQDLLRHTTLQYRAPEMVDPYLRLPIDEKSDVWALGVLLYKLCYYTTPFEEHGPLAILNVHYKIPPYPVYSQNMINLIVSMLQKYGKDRPSVFDLLDNVHRLRGTRSQFSYNPPPPPISSLSPFSPAPPTFAQAFNTNAAAGFPSTRVNAGFGHGHPGANAYVGHVTDPNAKSPSPSSADRHTPSSTSAAAARQHVLSAIQPMRRGRPGAIAPVISPTGRTTFAERDLLPASGHDPDLQRKQGFQQQQLDKEQQPAAGSPDDALVHVRPESGRYGQQWQRGKSVEPGQQQESRTGKQQGFVSAAKQFEHLGGTAETSSYGPAKANADAASSAAAGESGFGAPFKTGGPRKVDDDSAELRVRSGAGGRPASASPAYASADSGGRQVLEAWELRGPVASGERKVELGGGRGGGGGGAAGSAAAAFDGFADTFDFGGATGASSSAAGLAVPMSATKLGASSGGGVGLSASAPGSNSTLFTMYNPPTSTSATATAAAPATSAAASNNLIIPPTSTRVPTRTGPGAFNLGKRDAFEGLAGINFGSGSGNGTQQQQQTMGAAMQQSLNTPPIGVTAGLGNVGGSRSSPMLVPRSPGRGNQTPASVASELSAEERFPSIEDYERGSLAAPGAPASLQPPAGPGTTTTTDWRKALTPSPGGPSTNSAFHRPALTPQPSTSSVLKVGGAGVGSHILPSSGARSQHTTGTAMKDAEMSRGSAIRAGSGFTTFQLGGGDPPAANLGGGLHRRQSLNVSSKSGPGKPLVEPALPPRPAAKKPDLVGGGLGPRKPSAPPKDWLTGQDTGNATSTTPASTSTATATPTAATSPSVPGPGLTRKLSASFIRRASQYGELQQMSTGQSRKGGPPVPDKSSIALPRSSSTRPMSDSSGDEGPEDAMGSVPRPPAEPQVPESPKLPSAQPESPRKIRHPRRNSIVDLVSKYEAMDAAASARAAVASPNPKSPVGPPPPIASKPATLQGHTRGSSVNKRPSLDIPAPVQQGGRASGPRTSPTVETQGRRMSVSPSRRMPSPAPIEYTGSSQQQPVQAPIPSRPQHSPVLTTRPITPPTHSPSPERPYQGVASLISQWQKKTEAAGNPSRPSNPPKSWK